MRGLLFIWAGVASLPASGLRHLHLEAGCSPPSQVVTSANSEKLSQRDKYHYSYHIFYMCLNLALASNNYLIAIAADIRFIPTLFRLKSHQVKVEAIDYHKLFNTFAFCKIDIVVYTNRTDKSYCRCNSECNTTS